MKRKVIQIDEAKCVGCGLCANACHQSAIQIIDGKARLTSDSYCDGLGMCLPNCPMGAITLVEKDTVEFDENRKNYKEKSAATACGCPGQQAKEITKSTVENIKEAAPKTVSELSQWPVQLKLLNPNASYLDNADLLVAADCTAYAYGNIHQDFIKNRITVIGCPKLDDNQYYMEKFTEIFTNNDIRSVVVLKMEVPCCGGITKAVKEALLNAGKILPYREVTISVEGEIIEDR